MQRLRPYIFPLSSWVFIISAILFVSSQLIQFTNRACGYISSYLDDLVVMPIILTLALIFLRLFLQNSTFELPKRYLFSAFLYLSIYFEWWIPHSDQAFTSDWVDIVCYGIGTIAFALSRRPNAKG